MNKIRPFTLIEQFSLSQWHTTDDLQIYIVARILILAQKNWHPSNIALAFLITEKLVSQVIQLFNQYGLAPFILGQEQSNEGRIDTLWENLFMYQNFSTISLNAILSEK